MKKHIIIALVLSLLVLSSCGNKTSNTGKENSEITAPVNEANNANGSPENTTEAIILPDLPEADFEGHEFKIATKGPTHNVHWFARDIYAEEETGDTINDAVYKRNTHIEEKYNIVIKELPQQDPYGLCNKIIRAGSDDIDLISAGIEGCNNTLAANGMLHNLLSVEHLDFTKPWWDAKTVKGLSLANKLYSAIGDMTIMDKDATWVLMFNKDMIKNFSLDNPYELVKSGKWTMDAMYGMMKLTASDLDGDGKMTPTDQFGLVTQNKNTIDFYNGADEYVCGKDDSDMPYIITVSERGISALTKAWEMQTDKLVTITAEDWMSQYPNDTVWDKMQLVVFGEGRSLFYYAGNNRVTLLRSMDVNFGILPPPKFDETQTDYHVSVDFWCASSIAIPFTASNVERTAIILEALTAESHYTVLPAYYDISLKSKLTRDEESGDMLDLIFANRAYDISKMYNWGGIADVVTGLAGNKTLDIVSQFEKKYNSAEKNMEKTMDTIASFE
jgi:ABC-type glycerol-3-phosphate transport system substrate-binding protein